MIFSCRFVEMPTNNYIESSFWNFDALFQPQQHPARDAHDTFFLKGYYPCVLIMYVCVCVCVSACMRVHVWCACMRVCVCVCVCGVHAHACIHAHVCVCYIKISVWFIGVTLHSLPVLLLVMRLCYCHSNILSLYRSRAFIRFS